MFSGRLSSWAALALQSGQLRGGQARRLLHDSLGLVPAPDNAANALWVANLVVLKAFWRVGDPYRSHLFYPDISTMLR